MKKLLLISMLIGAMPLAMMAQDDDLYFVPKKKKAQVEQVKEYAPAVAPQPKAKSSYEVIDGDTTKLDVIDFTEGRGIYPTDSLLQEDYTLTKQMMRFDDYDVSDNAAFWAGYNAGRSTWAWHSPWYYSRYGYGWYDPWYSPWYSSWYYSGWYSPWYYSWYDPWYYGWYSPYYHGYYGWHSPYYYGYYGYAYGGGGRSHYYGRTGNAGTIDVRGRTSGGYRAYHRNTVAGSSSRMGSLRDRASSMGGGRVYSSGNTERSSSGNFSGRRGGNYNSSSSSRSSGSFSNSGSRSSGSFSGGGSRSSSGGGFSGGSRSSSGGGGSRMGGRR
ncbi:MAG: hypothetical protein IJQ64_00190 [Prevotella sp.]|nr:hypothetical protein [Prevotella sp.]